MNLVINILKHLLRVIIWCGASAFLCSTLSAQNLIKNPGFEDFATNQPNRFLDTSTTTFNNILYWRSATFDQMPGLAGPFNRSSTTVNPNSGDCHIYLSSGLNYNSSGRHKFFIQGILTDTLKKDCSYLFSFYFQPRGRLIPLPDADSMHCTNNRLGFYFSKEPVSDTAGISSSGRERWTHTIRHFDSLQITPQVAIPTDTFFTDTSNYTYFEQSFIAQGGEQYITMGNFYPIEQTLYKNLYTNTVFSTYLEDTTINQVSLWHIDELSLELIPQPNQAFTHSPDTNICPGESIALFARLEVPGNYLWSTGDTTPTISVTEAGVYSVTASCPCGLEYSAEITVEALNPLPVIDINDTNICENIGHILINLPPDVDYSLNGENQSNSIIISAEGKYTLIARNQCEEKSFDFNVGVIPCDFTMYIPNAFTPNSDGRNDCFHIAADNIYHFHIRIFNRWGQEVFASTDPNFCWDGTLNGNPLPQGVYTCRISFSDNELVPPKHLLRNIILIR